MTDRGATYRAGELDTPIIFRSNRFYTRGSDWYFSTREGLDQGPFSSRILPMRRYKTISAKDSFQLNWFIDIAHKFFNKCSKGYYVPTHQLEERRALLA